MRIKIMRVFRSFFSFIFLYCFINACILHASERVDEQDRLIAERVLFRHFLTQVKPSDPSLTVFICYDAEDKSVSQQVITFVDDLRSSNIPEEKIFFENRPGGPTTLYQHATKLFEAKKVFVIGSSSLKQKYEQKASGRGISSHQIENLLTRKIQKGVEGIIPVLFQGEKEENLPLDLLSSLPFPRHLESNYFFSFFDLLIDIDGGLPFTHPIKRLQEEFTESLRILSPEFVSQHADKLHQYQRETDEQNKLAFENSLTKQLLPKKSISRPWIRITDSVSPYYLPDPPERFQESAAEGVEKTYLTQLWEALHQTGQTTLSSKASVAGMGGIGKTTLALAYGYEGLEKGGYNIIYWLKSDTESSLIEGYKDLLRDLKVQFNENEGIDSISRLVSANISTLGLSLLIYDNVPDPNLLRNRTPQKGAHILVTSRCTQGWGNLPLNLEVFRHEDSIKYLLAMLGLKETEENKDKAGALAQELGHLPLALSHAASYIKYIGGQSVNCNTLEQYLKDFKEQPVGYFDNHKDPLGQNLEINHGYLIAKTLNISARVISDLAKQLLIPLAYLDPDSIMQEPFLEFAKDGKSLREAFADLCRFSFLKQSQQSYSIHRLVQLMLRQKHEVEQLSILPFNFNRMLSSFSEYRHSLKQPSSQGTELSIFQTRYRSYSGLNTNLNAFKTHLQSLSNNTKLDALSWTKIKFGAQALQDCLSVPLALIRKEIRARLQQDKSEVEGRKIQLALIKDELQEMKITLNSGLVDQILDILPIILSLGLNQEDTMYIIDRVCHLSSSDRYDFVEDVRNLLALITRGKKRINASVDTLEISPPQWSEYIEDVQPILTPEMEKKELAYTIRALRRIEPLQRPKFVDSLQQLLTAKLTGKAWSKVLHILGKESTMSRRELVTLIQSLGPLRLTENEWLKIINILGKEFAINRREFITIVQSLWASNMLGYNQVDIVRALRRVEPQERQKFAGIISSVLPSDAPGSDRADIIYILGHANAKQWQEFTDIIQSLLTPEIGGHSWLRDNKVFDEDRLASHRRSIKTNPNLLQHYKERLQQYRRGIEESINTVKKVATQNSEKPITKGIPLYSLPDRLAVFVDVERKNVVKKLEEQFSQSRRAEFSGSPRTAVILGPGGIGKTSLALSYAYQALDHESYYIIYWLNSETEVSLIRRYEDLLRTLDIPFEKDKGPSYIIELIKYHLPRAGRSLLIYDNVPLPNLLKDKIPLTNVDILITTRCSSGWGEPVISLDMFSSEESVVYLLQVTGLEPNEKNKLEASVLANELGHLPLALSQAANYIKYSGINFEDYLALFKENAAALLTRSGTPFSSDITRSIASLWDLTGQKLSPLAHRLMIYFAYLDPGSIAREHFLGCVDEEVTAGGEEEKELLLNEAFAELGRYALIRNSEEYFSIHRLVQNIIREQQEESDVTRFLLPFRTLLSSFDGCRKNLEHQLINKKALKFTNFKKLYQVGSALDSNLRALDVHFQRLASSANQDKDEWLKLELGTQVQKEFLGVSLVLLKKKIQMELESVPNLEDFEQVSPNILFLESSKGNECYIAEITIEIPDGTLVSTAELGRKRSIISYLRKTYSTQWHEMIDILHFLPIGIMTKEERADVIWALNDVDPMKRHEFIKVIHRLLAPQTLGGAYADMVWNLRWIGLNQLDRCINILRPLLAQKFKSDVWISLIVHLTSLAPEQRVGVCEKFMLFWALPYAKEKPQMKEEWLKELIRGDDPVNIFKTLKKVFD
jgi:DNA replication protein DnaC